MPFFRITHHFVFIKVSNLNFQSSLQYSKRVKCFCSSSTFFLVSLAVLQYQSASSETFDLPPPHPPTLLCNLTQHDLFSRNLNIPISTAKSAGLRFRKKRKQRCLFTLFTDAGGIFQNSCFQGRWSLF